ncbi:MAG: hypothetical protein HC854_03875 [Flavobacterium sp.]|nr:hypothetical protein [Flavobacterium sp.]
MYCLLATIYLFIYLFLLMNWSPTQKGFNDLPLNIAITLVVVFSSCLWFVEVFKNLEDKPLYKRTDFFYISSLLIYFTGTFLVFLMADFLIDDPNYRILDYWVLIIIFNLILRAILILLLESTHKVGTLILIGTGLIVILVLVLLSLAVFHQTYVMKMKRKEAELLLKTALESENQERKRIAADIHDGVSGDLNAIRNFLTVLYKGEKDTEKKHLFEEIKLGVEAAIENTRLLSYRLMPPLLESSGFLIAIEDYFERINTKTKANFSLTTKLDSFELHHDISYELFRVIQEFTTNMIKYGGITTCEVSVNLENNFYTITIIDDGIPFDFKEMFKLSKGTGLKNISSRLKVVNAVLVQKPLTKGNQFEILIKKIE